jgi:galactose mutarotase-like enzyme
MGVEMKSTIFNDQITFVSDSFNVEPWVLRFNDDDVNYFWRPESVKELGAAICFPLLGSLPDNKYLLDGKEYTISSPHGFAKDYDYRIVEKTESRIVYEIGNDEKTMKQFPYRFRFRVVYEVRGTTLKTEYQIKNEDTDEMYFSVGGHPRYACPIGGEGRFEDYYVEFEKEESIKNIVKSYGPISEIEKCMSEDGKQITLDYCMFTKGCFCLHPVESDYIMLKRKNGGRGLKVVLGGASHLQLWTVVDGPYIAFEPWYGSITSIPAKAIETDWKKRPGTLHIDAGEEYVCAYYATISR